MLRKMLLALVMLSLITPAAPTAPIPKNPVWERFKKICGDSESSRKLFDEMMGDKKRAAVIEKAEGSDSGAFEAYSSVAKTIKDEWSTAFQEFVGQLSSEDGGQAIRKRSLAVVSKGQVVAALFLGARPVPQNTVDSELVRFVESAAFIDLANGADKESVRKLYLAWLQQRTNAKALELGFRAALYGNISEVVPLARKKFEEEKLPPSVLGELMIVLGNHGKADDLPRLKKYRTDERVYSEYKTGRGAVHSSQIRDAAAAMSLKLHGQDIDAFDFDSAQYIAWWVGKDPAPFVGLSQFDTDERRTKALKKAWEWLDKQPETKGK